jgi:predicted enzyme related to lactoylglutathione lyase
MAEPASASLLRKIDCVMIRVPDLDIGAHFYEQACGLRRVWSDTWSVGLAMSDTDAEIVVHTMDLPPGCGVHYLVDDVSAAVAALIGGGSCLIAEPFEIPVGRCAVVADPFGNALCVLDLSKGTRADNDTPLKD